MSLVRTFGLTGGIGSGKSTVARLFAELGIEHVDADQVARTVVEPGQPALDKIAKHFGDEVLTEHGSLNRPLLRNKIFADTEERKWLEGLLHPLIRQQTENQLTKCQGPYRLLVSPLLLETDQHQLVDKIIVVDVPEQTQLNRASNRDSNSEQQIRAIIQAQMKREERLARADFILDNSGNEQQLRSQVEMLHQQLLSLAGR